LAGGHVVFTEHPEVRPEVPRHLGRAVPRPSTTTGTRKKIQVPPLPILTEDSKRVVDVMAR
jgi:hypothetical protein